MDIINIKESLYEFYNNLNEPALKNIELEFRRFSERDANLNESPKEGIFIGEKIIIFTDIAEKNFSFFKEKYPISLLDYCMIILCHEIGHAIDGFPVEMVKKNATAKAQDNLKTLEEYEDFVLKTIHTAIIPEINAWNNGKIYVKKDLIKAYDYANLDNLFYYSESILKFYEDEGKIDLYKIIKRTEPNIQYMFNLYKGRDKYRVN